MNILTTNTILYCTHWKETLAFYRDILRLPIIFTRSWFVEFRLTDTARLSLADEQNASVPSARGLGTTLSFKVDDIEDIHQHLERTGAKPGPIKRHAWEARVFFLHDPEGNRLEFWSPVPQD